MEEGFDVQGFDASDDMLEALQIKAKARNLKPTVWKGFVEDLKQSQKYKLIFIPAGSFCLIVDPFAVKNALKIFYDHLAEDGVLLFEGEMLSAIPPLDIWRGSIWHKPNGTMILSSVLSTFKDKICRAICKYELVEHNSVIRTEVEEYQVRIYEALELEEIIRSCGFKNVRMMKAFDSTAVPGAQDESIVYECRK
jgi:SAM-dependent methyltransferase